MFLFVTWNLRGSILAWIGTLHFGQALTLNEQVPQHRRCPQGRNFVSATSSPHTAHGIGRSASRKSRRFTPVRLGDVEPLAPLLQ